ncbi:CRISPR-associated endonuclease Cas1 [uncultured Thermosynechococcus sp.]|uniref:CRISPR-associated endonuclease Cas1 n=1 Tax=uncultured Thermosynechococcus sp. TaxID=436945 RepID=UPI0026040029|nr:CRISPR-associated endonuclease Cas1 [uncultured Thermosynechococcus sp.]
MTGDLPCSPDCWQRRNGNPAGQFSPLAIARGWVGSSAPCPSPPLALDLTEIFRVFLVDRVVIGSTNRMQWHSGNSFEEAEIMGG